MFSNRAIGSYLFGRCGELSVVFSSGYVTSTKIWDLIVVLEGGRLYDRTSQS